MGATLFNNKGLPFPTEGTSILTTDNNCFPPEYSPICLLMEAHCVLCEVQIIECLYIQ